MSLIRARVARSRLGSRHEHLGGTYFPDDSASAALSARPRPEEAMVIQSRAGDSKVAAVRSLLARCALAAQLMGLVMCSSIAVAEAAGDSAPTTPDPELIYERARDVWSNQVCPAYLHYNIVVAVHQNGRRLSNHYSAQFESQKNLVDVNAFSDEETAHPFVTHGINVGLSLRINSESTTLAQLSRDEEPTDYLGVPVLDPVYSFGLKRSSRSTAVSPQPSPSTLQTIGRVYVRQRDYEVSLSGIETLGGVEAYHLILRPLHDPKRYRLRGLWVDTQTFATLQLITDGNFTAGPSLGVLWTVIFRQEDGVEYVSSETANSPLNFDRYRHYDSATITFDHVTHDRPERGVTVLLKHPARDDELREPST
jgi:hypothetical protein